MQVFDTGKEIREISKLAVERNLLQRRLGREFRVGRRLLGLIEQGDSTASNDLGDDYGPTTTTLLPGEVKFVLPAARFVIVADRNCDQDPSTVVAPRIEKPKSTHPTSKVNGVLQTSRSGRQIAQEAHSVQEVGLPDALGPKISVRSARSTSTFLKLRQLASRMCVIRINASSRSSR